MSQPSLQDYPGYFPPAKTPWWNRTKAAVAAGLVGLFMGLLVSVGDGAPDVEEPPAASPPSLVDEATVTDPASEIDAAVDEAVNEAVAQVTQKMTGKLDQVRASAADRLQRVRDKAQSAQTRAVDRAVARARADEQRKTARAVANALASVPAAAPAPTGGGGGTDPRFDYCYNAQDAGYGPYYAGDTEYGWYDDADGDGVVCE